LDFVAEADGFVYLEGEVASTPAEIEQQHLRCLRSADFVWFHAPDGYVGPSGAFELGVAYLAGVPVYSRELPADQTLRSFVRAAESPAEAIAAVRDELPQAAGAPLT